MKPGPKSGTYKPSEATRAKMRAAKLGVNKDPETRRKIGKSVSKSLTGTTKSAEHREHISNSLLDLETKCLRRFEEMKADYPGEEEFFDANKTALLFAMRDCRSEKELVDLRRYVEVTQIDSSLSYEYSSSSIYAAEDTLLALLDAKRLLERTANLLSI